jgi:hypothetical protein
MGQQDDAGKPDIDLGFTAEEAHRAAHATEPRMGDDGGSENPDTITDAVVDPSGDNDQSYVPSKPVPTEGQGGLP